MRILGVDPGTFETAYTIFDGKNIISFGKVSNEEFIKFLIRNKDLYELVSVEMIKSYGMPIGDSVLETCVFIGRIEQTILTLNKKIQKVFRKTIATHICNNPRANDTNIKHALIDRFAKYTPNYGKGVKGSKGYFYGFAADVWQSFAVCVYTWDKLNA